MDTVNNSRFQPNVTGYYQVTGSMSLTTAVTSGALGLYIYKNGIQNSSNAVGATSNTGMNCQVTDVIYLNGSSDYLELFTFQNSGSTKAISNDSSSVYLDCTLVGGLEVPTGSITQGTSNTFKINSLGGGTGQAVGTTPTLLTLGNTIFDPTSAYTSGTGRFTPTTAGYYRLVGRAGVISSTQLYGLIEVNGGSVAANFSNIVTSDYVDVELSTVAYFNGTTDYAEFWVSSPSGATTLRTDNGGQFNEFSGELIGGVTSTPLATGPQLFKSFSGISLGTYVNLPGDIVQVAWTLVSAGLYTVSLKTTSGTIALDGIATYFRGTGSVNGESRSITFGAQAGTVATMTTTASKVNTNWSFDSTSDNMFLMFTDASTGYTYQIRAVLGTAGANNKYTIQRNISNA